MSELGGAPNGSETPEPPLDATATNLTGPRRLAKDAVVAGRYRIVESLGVGAMGIVYRAFDQELDLEVALKVLRPELSNDTRLVERFRQELVLARQVTHRHVVRTHDLGRDGDLVFLTMDLVEGRSLRQVLEKRGALPAREAADLAAQLARALAAAHDEGVVHRDLKASNVMLDDAGRAYITDFGIARSLTGTGVTRTGSVVGTPEYLSPEQVRGDDLDGRTDIYSLGVLLFELLTGELPISGRTLDETLAQHLSGVPGKLAGKAADIPPNLRAILKRCLEPERHRRYQEAAALAEDLERLERPPRRLPPARTMWRIGAGLAVAAIVVAGTLRWRGGRAPGEAAPGAALGTAIVVLPFADETGRPEVAWLSTGVGELLFESLIGEDAIRVVNPQRVVRAVTDLRLEPGAFGDETLELASELFDSSRLLTGSIREAPDGGIRIDARLVNPAAGPESAVFLHAQAPAGPAAATDVVAALERALLDRLEVRAATEEPMLSSPTLPEYSLAVRKLWEGDALEARRLLEGAVAEDPDFGAAWLRLSQASDASGQYERAVESAERAVDSLEAGEGLQRLRLLARAQLARLSGEPDRAQQVLRELVAAYPGDVESAVELADALGDGGQFGAALEMLATLTEERAPGNARAWFLRAKYSILSGQSRVAIDEYLVRAMVLQNKLKNLQGQADVLNAFGVAYRELGEMEQAEESYRRAAEIRREIGDERGYAASLHNLAQVAIFRGDFEAAEESLQRAMKIYEKLGDEAGIADFYNELGLMEEARSDYPRALDHYRAALEIRRRLGDQRAVAESLNNIGFANHQIGDYNDASVYWQQALDLYDEADNLEGQTTVRISLGQLHTTLGDWQQAQQELLAALDGARQLGWEPAVAATEGSLGRVAHYQGRYAPALDYFDDALARFATLGDERGTVEYSMAKAEALVELGEADAALDLLSRLEAPLASVGNSDQRADWLRLRGRALNLAGRAAEATAALRESETLAAASANRALRLRVGLARVAASGLLGDLEEIAAEARSLGDKQLELEAELWLADALAGAGRHDEAGEVATRLVRHLRRTGDWVHAYRLHELRAELAERRGEDPSRWRAEAATELERIGAGLDSRLLEQLRRLLDRQEVADAA